MRNLFKSLCEHPVEREVTDLHGVTCRQCIRCGEHRSIDVSRQAPEGPSMSRLLVRLAALGVTAGTVFYCVFYKLALGG